MEHRKQQVALQPQNTAMTTKIVSELISDPRPEARFGAEALEIARRSCEATEYKDIFALDALAAAYAETGDFAQAEATIRKALETSPGETPHDQVELQKRLILYHAHQKPACRRRERRSVRIGVGRGNESHHSSARYSDRFTRPTLRKPTCKPSICRAASRRVASPARQRATIDVGLGDHGVDPHVVGLHRHGAKSWHSKATAANSASCRAPDKRRSK